MTASLNKDRDIICIPENNFLFSEIDIVISSSDNCVCIPIIVYDSYISFYILCYYCTIDSILNV